MENKITENTPYSELEARIKRVLKASTPTEMGQAIFDLLNGVDPLVAKNRALGYLFNALNDLGADCSEECAKREAFIDSKVYCDFIEAFNTVARYVKHTGRYGNAISCMLIICLFARMSGNEKTESELKTLDTQYNEKELQELRETNKKLLKELAEKQEQINSLQKKPKAGDDTDDPNEAKDLSDYLWNRDMRRLARRIREFNKMFPAKDSDGTFLKELTDFPYSPGFWPNGLEHYDISFGDKPKPAEGQQTMSDSAVLKINIK